MTINLSALIVKTQRELSDITEDYISPEVIYQQIQEADKFLDNIMNEDTPETYLEWCIVLLGACYAYLNYTSMVEIKMGSLPNTSSIKLKELRQKAVTFINPYADQKLDENLNTDKSIERMAPIAIGVPYTVTDDDGT